MSKADKFPRIDDLLRLQAHINSMWVKSHATIHLSNTPHMHSTGLEFEKATMLEVPASQESLCRLRHFFDLRVTAYEDPDMPGLMFTGEDETIRLAQDACRELGIDFPESEEI